MRMRQPARSCVTEKAGIRRASTSAMRWPAQSPECRDSRCSTWVTISRRPTWVDPSPAAPAPICRSETQLGRRTGPGMASVCTSAAQPANLAPSGTVLSWRRNLSSVVEKHSKRSYCVENDVRTPWCSGCTTPYANPAVAPRHCRPSCGRTKCEYSAPVGVLGPKVRGYLVDEPGNAGGLFPTNRHFRPGRRIHFATPVTKRAPRTIARASSVLPISRHFESPCQGAPFVCILLISP
jgi:hypothetical protein